MVRKHSQKIHRWKTGRGLPIWPNIHVAEKKRFHLAEKTVALYNSLNLIGFSFSPSQLCSHTPSTLNSGAKRSGATCRMAMPQCCYLAKGAKRLMLSIFRLSETFVFLAKWIFGQVAPHQPELETSKLY